MAVEVVAAGQVLVVEEESSDMYKDFSKVYDLLMWDYDYEKWSEYYKEIFESFSIAPETILEVGAGTGSMTEVLSRDYREVVAIDPSPAMLTLAREKLFDARNVRFLLKDIRDFEIEKKFDACVAACDVMNYMLTKEDFILALKNVRGALREGGLFLFDMSSYYKLSEILGDNTFIHDTEDIYYVFQGEFAGDTEHIDLNIFIKEGDFYKRYSEVQSMRAYKIKEVLSMVDQAGFREFEALAPFSFSRPKEVTERILFLGRK